MKSTSKNIYVFPTIVDEGVVDGGKVNGVLQPRVTPATKKLAVLTISS